MKSLCFYRHKIYDCHAYKDSWYTESEDEIYMVRYRKKSPSTLCIYSKSTNKLTEYLLNLSGILDVSYNDTLKLCISTEENVLILDPFSEKKDSGVLDKTRIQQFPFPACASAWAKFSPIIAIASYTKLFVYNFERDWDFKPIDIWVENGDVKYIKNLSDIINKKYIGGYVDTDVQLDTDCIEFNDQKSHEISIAWGNQDHWFAVNIYNQTMRKRQIRIYGYDLALVCVIDVKNIQAQITFMPLKDLYCYVQLIERDKHIFFMDIAGRCITNINVGQVTVKKLEFSPCERCFFVWNADKKGEWIDIYTRSNDTWYLKQRLPFDNSINSLVAFAPIKFKSNIAVTIVSEKIVAMYVFVFKVFRGNPINDILGLTATIRGKELLGFCLSQDMLSTKCKTLIELEECISNITFSQFENIVAITDSRNVLHFYDYAEVDNWKLIYRFDHILQSECIPIFYYNHSFREDNTFSMSALNCTEDYCFEGLYINIDLGQHTWEIKQVTRDTNCTYNSIMLNKQDKVTNFPLPLSPDSIVEMAYIYLDGKTYSFHLTVGQTLCINNEPINGYYTSLHFRNPYMFLTKRIEHNKFETYKLQCIYLDLTNVVKILETLTIDSPLYETTIDRGSEIINISPDITKILLQAPRGNIEIKYFYHEIVKQIAQHIDSGDYNRALGKAREYSLPSDIVFDLDPEKFIKNISTFYLTVPDDLIIKFLLDITDKNWVTALGIKFMKPIQVVSKRKVICDALINKLSLLKDPLEGLSILAFAGLCCTDNYNINSALKLISNICSGLYKTERDRITITLNALSKYISYDIMYNEAINLNDYHLCNIIMKKVEICNPDVVSSLRAILNDQNDLKNLFNFYHHLKKHDVAVLYYFLMFKKNDVTLQVLIDYALNHNVEENIYEFLNPNDMLTKNFLDCYGTKLVETKHARLGAFMFKKAGLFQKAINAYMDSGFWHEAIATAHCTNDYICNLKSIAKQLEIDQKYVEAAEVYLDHIGDTNEGLRCLLLAEEFKKAYSKSFVLHCEKEFIPLTLVPAMKQHLQDVDNRCVQLCEDIIKKFEQLQDWKQRQKKIVEANEKLESNRAAQNIYGFDVKSIASTATTMTCTSRKTQKEMKKFTKSTVGSKYEDIALLSEIHEMVSEIFNLLKQLNEGYSFMMVLVALSKPQVEQIVQKIDKTYETVTAVTNELWQDTTVYKNFECLSPKCQIKPEVIRADSKDDLKLWYQ